MHVRCTCFTQQQLKPLWWSLIGLSLGLTLGCPRNIHLHPGCHAILCLARRRSAAGPVAAPKTFDGSDASFQTQPRGIGGCPQASLLAMNKELAWTDRKCSLPLLVWRRLVDVACCHCQFGMAERYTVPEKVPFQYIPSNCSCRKEGWDTSLHWRLYLLDVY